MSDEANQSEQASQTEAEAEEREQKPRRRRRGGRRRRERENHPGAVFLVDKPSGPTSHDIVALVRRWTGLRRVGHGGTLDPLATGLLPIFVGAATRLNEYLAGYDKSYEATVLLGAATDTDDSEGEVIARSAVPELSFAEVATELARFAGEIEQVPPQYSAIKRDGVTAHRAARAGEPLEMSARTVTVHEISLTALELPQVRIAMRVSTGTYVRAIARDLGAALGCGAHVVAMRRTRVGSASAGEAHTPEALSAAAEAGEIWGCSLPAGALFPDWPQFGLSGEQLQRVRRGQSIRQRPVAGQRRALALDGDERVVAVLEEDELTPARWNPIKVLGAR